MQQDMDHESAEIIDHADTPIGTLYLQKRRLDDGSGTVMTDIVINGALFMSNEHTISERTLATSALAMHQGGDGLSVLVGGLGLGYTAYEALQDERVGLVEVAERLPKVGEWLFAGKLPLSETLTPLAGEERFVLTEADVYADLLGPAGERRWDLLLIDVDHSPHNRLDEASAPFYTVEGQRRVAQHLQPGGVTAVWSAGASDDFAAVMDEVYPHYETETVAWECPVQGKLENVLFLGRLD